jgi:hypothetical protein
LTYLTRGTYLTKPVKLYRDAPGLKLYAGRLAKGSKAAINKTMHPILEHVLISELLV